MSYASYDELITRYPAASKWAETQTQVETSFLYYAEAELNGLLGTVFTVPFTAPVPDAIVDLTVDLAYVRKMRTQDPEKAAAIEKAVYGRIDRIKKGEEVIVVSGSTQQAATSPIWSSTQDYTPVHSMLDAEESSIDPDQLEAEEAERS